MGGPELFPGVGAAIFAAKPFAVQKMGASEFGTESGAAEPFDRVPVQVFRRLALADQRAAAGLNAQRPVGAGGLGGFRELVGLRWRRARCSPCVWRPRSTPPTPTMRR